MRIFITGATGVLGRRVVQKLQTEGHQISALCRSVNNFQALERMGVKPVWGNIFDPAEMRSLTVGQEIVMHLASSVPLNTQKLRSADWLNNDLLREKATDALAQASVANGVKLFVAPGVMLAYGDQQGKMVSEATGLSEKLPADLLSAVRMETIVQNYVRKSGLQAVVMRLGVLYAEDSRHTQAMIEQLQRQETTLVGKGDNFLNLIHADDAASAIVQVVKHYGIHLGETYNICDGVPVKMRDFVEYLAQSIDAPAPKSISSLPALLRYGFDHVKVAQLSFRAENSKAVQKLKWQPVLRNYKEGIDQIVARVVARTSQKAA